MGIAYEQDRPWYVSAIIVPLIIAVVVGGASSYIASEVALAQHEERISAIEDELEITPTRGQLNAAEDRARSYTDAKFSEIMITLTQLNSTSKNTAEDIKEIKTDIRVLERRGRR